MILYFSATGNSEYVAKRIGAYINDETVNLFDKIHNKDFSGLHSDKPWVIVVPTYAWQIPHIVEDWLKRTPLSGSNNMYFVLTGGLTIMNSAAYLKKLCKFKNMNYMGCREVIMPHNYLVLFTVPKKEQALEIIGKADSIIDDAAYTVKNGGKFAEKHAGVIDKVFSGPGNFMFSNFFTTSKGFYATRKCKGCGKCAEVCPLDNISIKNGKPVWGKDCTHCMACISKCPSKSIEFTPITKGKTRYVFPK